MAFPSPWNRALHGLAPLDAGAVSIVVAVHVRNPRTIHRLLAVLDQQCYAGALEVLVCDDGSPDPLRLEDTCRKWHARYLRVERPAGSEGIYQRARTANAGIREARGRYVLLLDQDTFLVPYHVQNCVNLLAFHGDRVVCHGQRAGIGELLECDQRTPFSRFHLDLPRVLALLQQVDRPEPVPFHGWGQWTDVLGHNLFVAKSLLEEVGFLDEGYVGWGEDDRDLVYRLHRAGCLFAHMQQLRVYHVEHPRPALWDRPDLFRRNVVRFFQKFPETREERRDAYQSVQDELSRAEPAV